MAPTRQIAGCLRGFTSWALRALALGTISLSVAALPSSAKADSVSDFYTGKTLSLLIGFPPGVIYEGATAYRPTGLRRRTISVVYSLCSVNERAGPPDWKRRLSPIAKRYRKGRGIKLRLTGQRRKTILA